MVRQCSLTKDIIVAYEHTQELSRKHAGKNFRCPTCDINRIAKAKLCKEEWNHTGCKCTMEYLDATGQKAAFEYEKIKRLPGTR